MGPPTASLALPRLPRRLPLPPLPLTTVTLLLLLLLPSLTLWR